MFEGATLAKLSSYPVSKSLPLLPSHDAIVSIVIICSAATVAANNVVKKVFISTFKAHNVLNLLVLKILISSLRSTIIS